MRWRARPRASRRRARPRCAGGELDRDALRDVADLVVGELGAVQLGTGVTGAARRDRAGAVAAIAAAVGRAMDRGGSKSDDGADRAVVSAFTVETASLINPEHFEVFDRPERFRSPAGG